ncbi:YhgE/Pip domain-containing protein [Lysinibacillus sp. SGAir0095]|uniref:YhgE/Pip domain-containing protein n=1 Tax=Lysinibacillus sp. SGAir0095 TaxID=2070463 RepID=UPI0010CCE5B8|nr:ABC transporter permease [Lysinibacillus sp. SGAir0095]QCR31940.1 phage infection protein [Lysinibacillus sp. SGAir0095]
MFKNKLVLALPLIALAIIFLFSMTLFPSIQPQPKNLPIAIVNEDEGVQILNQPLMNMGQSIVEMIQESSAATDDEDPMVKWVEVKSNEEVQKGLDDQKYYAALVIPKDFSAKQASLQTPEPSSPKVQIYINQGMNMPASTVAGQILNGVVENMNNMVRQQLIDGFEKQGATLTTKQAEILVAPIVKNVTNVNEVGNNTANGNAPMTLFQPLWMGSLATAAILFFTVNKMTLATRKERLWTKIGQILMATLVALVIGFGFTWIAGQIVGLNIPVFMDTALFLAVSSISFILMILAVFSLIGFRGMPIFVLILFFGAPLLALAPEMMPAFYQDWVYPWLPMRFMIEGLRKLFFFNAELSWDMISIQVTIAITSMLVILASIFKKKKETEVETKVETDAQEV